MSSRHDHHLRDTVQTHSDLFVSTKSNSFVTFLLNARRRMVFSTCYSVLFIVIGIDKVKDIVVKLDIMVQEIELCYWLYVWLPP